MRIVALLSGGMDSTALCHHLLTDFAHEVHIHHMTLGVHHQRYSGDRADIERHVTRQIVTWLRENCRPFAYSESDISIDLPDYPGAPSDHTANAYFGALLINKGVGDVLATGRIATDCNAATTAHVMAAYDAFQVLTSPPVRLRAGGQDRSGRPVAREVYWVTPIIEWTKAEELARVPRPLLDLAVSCRRPEWRDGEIFSCTDRRKAGEKIRICRTCNRVQQAEDCLARNLSVPEANDWLCANPPKNGRVAGKYYDGYQAWPIALEDIEKIEIADKRYGPPIDMGL